MAKPKRGMGRGLEAILSVSAERHTADELRELPVELIVANPNQPRRHFDEETLNALAGSLQVISGQRSRSNRAMNSANSLPRSTA